MTTVDAPKATRVSVALMKSDMSDATIFTLQDQPDSDRFHIIDDGTYLEDRGGRRDPHRHGRREQ